VRTGRDGPESASNRVVERIDPARAAAGYARWRRALAEALGADPGARLDYPAYRPTLYKIFGATRRLSELCMKHPAAAAEAILDGPSPVLAEVARDLAPLAAAGAGGPDQLHAALAPLKNRADIAIAVAEISGAWTQREATAARADLAERMVDAALAWLLRAAVNRGDLAAPDADAPGRGVFALAGGDFAHLDLAPYGPLQLVIVYDEEVFSGAQSRMAERAFVRLGTELREAFDGRPGDHPVFGVKTVFGSGVNGSGFAESKARLTAAISAEAAAPLRAWLASARVVAGDRSAGGQFLESVESTVWSGAARLPAASGAADDPRAPFRHAADFFRRAFGAGRPVFRAASAHEVFAAASASGALCQGKAARLAAGDAFVQTVVAFAQMMKGGATTFSATDEDERRALACLAGFADPADLEAALDGALADARNTLRQLTSPPLAEFERFRPPAGEPDDIDKLGDLGFLEGAAVSAAVDQWSARAASETRDRFAALAPGLLTAFGETQRPDAAARLFDALMKSSAGRDGVPKLFAASGRARDGAVAAIGCFSAATAPLAEDDALLAELADERGAEAPEDAREWMMRYPAPSTGAPVEEIARWRRQSIARVGLHAGAGSLSFDAAPAVLEAIGETALMRVTAAAGAGKGGEGLAVYVVDGAGRGLPGAPAVFGFIKTNKAACPEAEDVARAVVAGLEAMGDGHFAMTADLSHRPGGASGALAPDAATFKAYIQSGAIASEQILFARARVVAGQPAAQDAARGAVRSAVMNPRRADTLLREIDRARAQRLRRDRSASEWDLDHVDGGPLDVDLLISTLIYRHAAAQPAIQQTGPDGALDILAKAGLVSQNVADTLKSARRFWARLATAKALARWSDPQTEPVRPRFAALLAHAAGVQRFQEIRPLMRGHAEEVSRLYTQLVLGRPAQSLVANG
jgi:glutamate-ammonia-ligase adenylyltransferase